MTIGDRIRVRREQLNMSQDELARKICYKSRSSINKIELNLYNLKQSKIKLIADALLTTPSYIMGWSEQSKQPPVRIPVLGRVAAGIPFDAEEYIIDWEVIPATLAEGGDYFGLAIKGDSMEPKISDGDVVIVRKQSDADSGDLVIALINGDDATCKRLMKYKDGIALISSNPKYPPFQYSKEEVEGLPVEIIGKVIELRAKF